MTLLDEIAAARRGRVAEARRRVSLDVLEARCDGLSPARSLREALEGFPAERRAVIAEVKRRSPSKGPLRPDLDPANLARAYERAGAAAVSVLVEPDYFGGGAADLEAARGATELPVLYKDFVVDPYQVREARALGADLVLLIAALLGRELGAYLGCAREVGLEALVEVHDGEELALALDAGARLVGVNNRNLKTFRVDLAASEELLPRLPPGVLGVSESGISGVEAMDRLARAGAKAFLIGEALVRDPDPEAALRRLVARGA